MVKCLLSFSASYASTHVWHFSVLIFASLWIKLHIVVQQELTLSNSTPDFLRDFKNPVWSLVFGAPHLHGFNALPVCSYSPEPLAPVLMALQVVTLGCVLPNFNSFYDRAMVSAFSPPFIQVFLGTAATDCSFPFFDTGSAFFRRCTLF
mgnify:CR=1 FL=1